MIVIGIFLIIVGFSGMFFFVAKYLFLKAKKTHEKQSKDFKEYQKFKRQIEQDFAIKFKKQKK